jgi:DNA-directed RNA polymerase subunit RPC12/RpoP
MVYFCAKCGTRFGLRHLLQKVKYQDMAKTVFIEGREKTFYWKEIFCAACVKKYNIN